jgi:hypothetical protein
MCTREITSKSAGLSCTKDEDCPTTDSTTYAKCRCGFSTKGIKYCDIMKGD